MLKVLRRFKAQSVGEYTIMFSIAVLAIVAMTYFIQRLFSARINDAGKYMLTTLNPDVVDVHVSRGGKAYNRVLAGYEPYYMQRTSDMATDTTSRLNSDGPFDIYRANSRTTTMMNSVSTELPAQDDEFHPPPWWSVDTSISTQVDTASSTFEE